MKGRKEALRCLVILDRHTSNGSVPIQRLSKQTNRYQCNEGKGISRTRKVATAGGRFPRIKSKVFSGKRGYAHDSAVEGSLECSVQKKHCPTMQRK